MTATDVLRRLLDERGVEHYDGTESTLWLKDEHGYRASADELTSGRMSVHMWCETPEQAIAATLGATDAKPTQAESSETCHIDLVGYNQHEDRFQCRSCDWSMWFKRGTWPQFNYCPNCGRRIEQ